MRQITTIYYWLNAICFVLFFAYGHSKCSSSGDKRCPFSSSTVTQMLEQSYGCHRNPAMAVAVVKEDKVIYSHGFGHLDLDERKPVTSDSVFGIASVSKSFAAALLVKLLDEKTNLTFNSKVRDLLGDSFVMPDRFRTEETTFLDLLSHKTGMLSNNFIRFDESFNRDTLLSRLSLLATDKQFRVDYSYNNLVYGLVGTLAEIIDGKHRWEELVEKHFFKPLGMLKSTFSTAPKTKHLNYVQGYYERDGKAKYEKVSDEMSRRWGEMCSSGAIKSSVKDMTKWMMFHLSRGKNEKGDDVMKSALVDSLHRKRFTMSKQYYTDTEQPRFPITASSEHYAMGLKSGHYRGYPMLSHTGTSTGFVSYMTLLPRQQIGVISLFSGTDKYYRHRTAVNHYLLDSALGAEPYLDQNTICTYPNPWLNKKFKYYYRPQTSSRLRMSYKTYEGTYHNKAYGYLNIDYNKLSKALEMSYGWGRWQLVPRSYIDNNEQRFYAKGIEPVSPTDIARIHFIFHPKLNNKIIGVRGTYMEKRRPPIFCHSEYKEVCSELEFKLYANPDEKPRLNSDNDTAGYYKDGQLCKEVCFDLPHLNQNCTPFDSYF